MRFDELEKNKMYRVVKGNDTLVVGDLVWTDTLNPRQHLNVLSDAACLDEDDISDGALCDVEFEPADGWHIETKVGLGGYSRASKVK